MPKRLSDLVGRAMIDAEFLAELREAPERVLSQYELTEAEGAAVKQALRRLDRRPSPEQIVDLKDALLRRVST
jgi:hypothetical protein